MRNPIVKITGKVTDIGNGYVTVRANYDDWQLLVDREVKEVEISLLDSRRISPQQRKAIYSLLNAIADWSGDYLTSTKEHFKLRFAADVMQDTAEIFSLSNVPMSVAAAFQKYLVEFMIEWGVPTSFPLYEYTDDIEAYVYACAINRKCAVCGSRAELHHIDRVGIGRDRHDIIHEGMEAIPLCRRHHTEIHSMGDHTFFKKYHFDGGIILDDRLCKVYDLKRRRNAKQNN